ncbi:hypothetical protein P885DRAFT_64912 [Corynascus similis CBS 632.67]
MAYAPTATDTIPQPAKLTTLPPVSISLPFNFLAHLPQEIITSPTALRFPAAWRCGTCMTLHSIRTLMTTTKLTTARTRESADKADEVDNCPCPCPCRRPALQAVYDQFGELYLFWRDDPAVSDLSVPHMADEARRRVRVAGGEGADEGSWWGDANVVQMSSQRPGTGMSNSSVASDTSEDSTT